MSLWDIIVWPFARLLEILYNWTDSYGLAIILFALVVNLILLPFMAKSKKGMMKTTRIQPQLKELEKKHRGNQQKYQQEVMKLYKEQGASPTSGCLWSLIPFPILIALYSVIRQPLGSMMGLGDESIKKLTDWATQNAGFVASKQGTYDQIGVADAIHKNWDAVTNALGNFDGKLLNIDYSFLGMNLGSIPDWKIWNFDFSSADILATIGLFLIPIIAAFLSWASMKISQATNPPQAGQAQMSMKTMNLMMPIMSIWICFIMPAALGVYWIANSCFGIVRDLVLTKHYKRKLDIEDAERIAAQKEKEAEQCTAAMRSTSSSRWRVQRPAITTPAKKKMQAQQKQADAERIAASERAEREARREKLGIEKPENPSQVGKRRYARGRAYDPSRYADEMAAAEEVNEPVEETAAQTEGEPEQSQENSET